MQDHKKSVVFWQREPYDAFAGGDGLYLHQLKQFLVRSGWDVVTLTSNFGRPRAFLEQKYRYPGYKSVIRGTIGLGTRHIFGPEALLVSTFNFLARTRSNRLLAWLARSFQAREMGWTQQQVRGLSPTLLIKCFDVEGAGAFRSCFASTRLHLIGFLNHDEYHLSESRVVANHAEFGLSERDQGIVSADPASGVLALGFSSRHDRDRIARTRASATPLYIGIGFEPKFTRRVRDAKIVLFVGNKTAPNRRSIEYFLAEIWPTIHAQIPDAQLRIVGRVCQYLEQTGPNVHCVGEVEDLSEEYSAANVVVAPLVTGSAGVKTKVAEGFQYGRAVITTSLGVDPSVPDQFADAALIADTPQDYAAATIRLLADERLRSAMEARSEEIFMKNFSSAVAYADFERWIGHVVPGDGAQDGTPGVRCDAATAPVNRRAGSQPSR
jgi:glycosyltransferase involved in cell wall biosynthesis